MQNHPQGSGYFSMPERPQSREEVIARVCAMIEKDLCNKHRNKDTRTAEEIQQAKDDYWAKKMSERYAIKLRKDNFETSFMPPLPPVYGPVQPVAYIWKEVNYYGRGGAVRSE